MAMTCGFKPEATGADLLWRVKKNLKPVFVEDLGDGSWLGEIRRGGRAGRKANPVRVRVIDYTVDNGTLDTDGDDEHRRRVPVDHHRVGPRRH
jgi:hypothetical protein